MKDIDNLCCNCFNELTNGSICSECGYDNDSDALMEYLSPKTIIRDRYVIGAVCERESDSVTYMAYDLQFKSVCNVREFLPKGIANRLEGNYDIHVRERYRANFDKYKSDFIELWSTIVKLHSMSAVITTYDVFEENMTAYAVSEYFETMTLREFLLKNPEGHIDWEQARVMFMPVLTTLEALHNNGVIHGAICPDNLLLCRDGKIRLKGFCISQANTMSSQLEFNVNDGYTALEQYDNSHKMCFATDIYSFAACIYRALVGQNPPDSKSRELNDKLMIPNTIAEKIPAYVIKALGGALQIYPEKRFQKVDDFRQQLNVEPSVVAANGGDSLYDNVPPAPKPVREKIEAESKNDKTGKVIAAILVVLVVFAIVAGVFISKSGVFDKEIETTTAAQQYTYSVPDFAKLGYVQSDIENNGAWNSQFKITFVEEYSTEFAKGIVFKQSVAAGETVEKGTEIVLTVSKGIETAQVIDVGGLKLEDAREQLEKAGFKISVVEVYNNGDYPMGVVKPNNGMAPAAGDVVAKGEEIILQVYGEVESTTQPETTTQPTTASPQVEFEME